MFERALIVVAIIVLFFLVLEALRRLILRTVNQSIGNELLKEDLHSKKQNQSIVLFHKCEDENILASECVEKFETEGTRFIIGNGMVLGQTK